MMNNWKQINLHPDDQQTWGLFKAVIKKMDDDKLKEIKINALNKKLSENKKREIRETFKFILQDQDDDPNIQMIKVLKEI
jgi:predicted metalloendopeptidase